MADSANFSEVGQAFCVLQNVPFVQLTFSTPILLLWFSFTGTGLEKYGKLIRLTVRGKANDPFNMAHGSRMLLNQIILGAL